MGVLLLLHVLLVAVAARAPATDAWGKEGHYMVCKIAESFLTEEASTAVKDLLPGWAGGDLAETCSWADTQRFRYRWSSPLHFADTPGDCEFDYARDCHNTKGEKDMCVVGAINNYTAALKDSSSPFDPTESLMFLAHFVGDVHQPLHCGHTDDLGGNTTDSSSSSSSSSCTLSSPHLRHNSQAPSSTPVPLPAMELAASASASVCSAAYHHLSAPAAAADRGGDSGVGAQEETTTTRLDRRRRKRAAGGGGGCAGLRRRCYAVLKQQRTRLYILRRCVTMLLCWHERDLSD